MILLIDGMNLIHRSYYAYPKLTAKDGTPTGALLGFMRCIKRLINNYNPSNIIVCLDVSKKNFRREIYEEYKSNRKGTEKDLRMQFNLMKKFLNKSNIFFIEKEGYEADDLIGSLAKQAKHYNLKSYIVSGDKDMFQLINNNTNQLYFSNKGIIHYDEQAVISKYNGLFPMQLIDLKALSGDASDNIPGVTGIGEKTAIKLLNKFKTLDGIYENISFLKGKQKENLEKEKENAYIYKQLITIDCNIDLDFERLFSKRNINIYSTETNLFLKSLNISKI